MSEDAPLGIEWIEYEGAAKSISEVREVIDSFLSEADLDPSILAGIDLTTQQIRDGIRLEPEGEGFAPLLVLVFFAPAINHAASTLWDTIILPRIKKKLRSDALGDEVRRGSAERNNQESGDDSSKN